MPEMHVLRFLPDNEAEASNQAGVPVDNPVDNPAGVRILDTADLHRLCQLRHD